MALQAMAICSRRYEIMQCPEALAEGPPYVFAHFLVAKDAYDLVPTIQKWKDELGKAAGVWITLVLPGDNAQSDLLYKELRTSERADVDRHANTEYREELLSMGATQAAEIHLHLNRTLGQAQRFGVSAEEIPCILWRIFPEMQPPLLTPIKPEWYRDDSTRNKFAKALTAWLRKGSFLSLMDGSVSVGDFRRRFASRVKNLAKQIDGAVVIRRRRRGLEQHLRRTGMLVSLKSVEPEVLKWRHPAIMVVSVGSEHSQHRLTARQLFYLLTLLLRGAAHRIDGANSLAVSEDTLVSELLAWDKAGIRPMKLGDQERPSHRVSKEWRQFADQMHKSIEEENVFFGPRQIAGTRTRYYGCFASTVRLSMPPDELSSARQILATLTRQSLRL